MTGGVTLTPERRWRRRSLWLLPLALLAAYLVPARDELLDFWRSRELFARTVVEGTGHRYAGALWRLEAIRTALDPEPGVSPAAIVRARLAVVVEDRERVAAWLDCRIALVDARGRRWAARSFSLAPAGEGARTCGSLVLEPPPAGTAVTLEHDFLVLWSLRDRVELTLGVRGEGPRYLRFERPTAAESGG